MACGQIFFRASTGFRSAFEIQCQQEKPCAGTPSYGDNILSTYFYKESYFTCRSIKEVPSVLERGEGDRRILYK